LVNLNGHFVSQVNTLSSVAGSDYKSLTLEVSGGTLSKLQELICGEE
jgi:hypothetical protein